MPSPDEQDELGLTAVTLVGDHGATDEVRPGHLQMVVIGNGTFATHPLPDGAALTIGRSNRCDVAINDQSISRRHAILSIGETVTIEDLGSANGTRVRGNSVKLGRPVQVAVGELIGLGKANIILQHRSWPTRTRRVWAHDEFETRVAEECARQQRSGVGFALLHVHTDRRSQIGVVEDTLCELVRESDILGKHGTSDFELLLTDTPPNKADEAQQRIEGQLLERGLKCRLLAACCPRDGRSADELIARLKAAPLAEVVVGADTGIVVSDEQMRSLHQMVQRIAGSQIGVLLLGETGVGKEVFARAVHHASQRAAGPFVELNCAALTETLLESELFGHEKGAFTNATSAKPGLIETAQGGTLLLDEIGDMPLSTQVKLLRVIENSQLRRVGALKARPIDVRFVAATNSDLEAQIAAGTFRRDLFFRLNGVTLVIPPLRERLSELEPLARVFISRALGDAQPPPIVTAEALELMTSYSWPGNVRELKHMMERAVLLSGGGPIRPEHLPADKLGLAGAPRTLRGTASPDREPTEIALPVVSPPRGSDEEQKWLLRALERSGGNQTVAARILGISRRTLINRLNDFKEIPRPRKGKKPQREA